MKLIIGLGNPGKEYEHTRHNIGFMCLDNFAKKNKLGEFKNKFNGLYIDFVYSNEKILLLKPLSYMNLSGTVVSQYVNYFKINMKDILIIHDDLDMPLGKLKLKHSGSSGGHNGIKSIIEQLGTSDFNHLKFGISKSNTIDVKDYVTGKFNNEELCVAENLMDTTNSIIEDFLLMDFEKLMSKYNGAYNEIN